MEARRRAMASPTPRPAPVTTATCDSSACMKVSMRRWGTSGGALQFRLDLLAEFAVDGFGGDPEGGADALDLEEFGARVVVPLDHDAIANGLAAGTADRDAVLCCLAAQAREEVAGDSAKRQLGRAAGENRSLAICENSATESGWMATRMPIWAWPDCWADWPACRPADRDRF